LIEEEKQGLGSGENSAITGLVFKNMEGE